MNFKSYLNESALSTERVGIESRTQPITEEIAINLIKNNCQQILNYYKANEAYIWRGIGFFKAEYGFIQPQQQTRISRNTYNFYTLLFDDILPSWQGFPKRGNGVICSSNEVDAQMFTNKGKLYVVFPFDGSKIGICSFEDLWGSFPELRNKMFYEYSSQLNELNEYILKPIYALADDTKQLSTSSKLFGSINKNTLIKGLHEIDQYDTKAKQNQLFIKFLNKETNGMNYTSIKHKLDALEHFLDQMPKSINMIAYLNTILNPLTNGFKLWQLPKLELSNNREVWTDGNCVFVEQKHLIPLMKKL